MIKLVGLLLVLAILTSCGAGGGAVSTPGARVQTYWPEIGLDRYKAVVFPAEAIEP